MTKQCKEACNSECFVAVPNNLKVYSMFVVIVGEKGDEGVNRDHEEDTDDTESPSVLAEQCYI